LDDIYGDFGCASEIVHDGMALSIHRSCSTREDSANVMNTEEETAWVTFTATLSEAAQANVYTIYTYILYIYIYIYISYICVSKGVTMNMCICIYVIARYV